MTMEKIRQKARDLHAKTRRELFGSITAVLTVLAFSGYGILKTHDPALRSIFGFAIAWVLAGQYFLRRGMWSATLPGDAALSTGLEFYRREIKRRRYLFGRALQWSFLPVVLSIGAFIVMIGGFARVQGVSLGRMLPFCMLMVLWMVAVFVLRSRAQRDLRREIDELNDIEKESVL